MKIYFIASLYGKEKYDENYRVIVKNLENLGYSVQADHVLKHEVTDLVEKEDEDRITYYKKILNWINTADIVVADITSPSSSVGHEVTLALEKGKPVIALGFKGVAPYLFKAIQNDKFQLLNYTDLDKDLQLKLKKALKIAQKSMDIRFNFFISPEIVRYLDWVAKVKRVPRSVYLRDLIEDDMKKHKDYGTQG